MVARRQAQLADLVRLTRVDGGVGKELFVRPRGGIREAPSCRSLQA